LNGTVAAQAQDRGPDTPSNPCRLTTDPQQGHSDRNFTGYCNRELEQLFRRQSREVDQEKRKQLVWDIDTTLQEEGARPVIFHTRGATCWQPKVRGLTTMVNSMCNGWRMEDVCLEK
jgi:peptide/nickel transport system substrate-binding protein